VTGTPATVAIAGRGAAGGRQVTTHAGSLITLSGWAWPVLPPGDHVRTWSLPGPAAGHLPAAADWDT
jgi:hypothetical protein